MEFDEARVQYNDLVTRLKNKKISREEFQRKVAELRVLDSSGRWWQPDPASGQWLVWTGTAWVRGSPPSAQGELSGGASVRQGPGIPKDQMASSASTGSHYHFMDMKSFRETARSTQWKKRPQKWWDLFIVLAGITSAVIWLVYTGVPASSEGYDFFSALLMVVIPVFLVMFRTRIDPFLIPLQPYRKKIPPMFLTGVSIVIPFLTSFILYNFLGITQYSLMQWNLIIGTFLAYCLSRNPIQTLPGEKKPVATRSMILIFIFVLVACITPVIADHCDKDPLNARDCMRTGMTAPVLAGIPASLLGNGGNVPGETEEEEDDEGGDESEDDDEWCDPGEDWNTYSEGDNQC